MKHLLSIKDLNKKEILDLVKLGINVKKNPNKFKKLNNKSLLMMFEAPSLRTRLSFEVAMFQLGGSSINYNLSGSPWGKGKESVEDTSKVISRYNDAVALRIYNHEDLVKFSKNSKIPVINMMTNLEHPCQILGDLMTILEKKKSLKGKICYLGDSNNNVTYSLMFACQKLGIKMSVGCPKNKEFYPDSKVIRQCKNVKITSDIKEAIKDSDVVYTDSWMSYRIPESQRKKRVKILKPYQVNGKVMKFANKNAIFMHCLPALRGFEVSKEVIDGKQSVVFDQAENRLHIEKAILLELLGR